MVDSVDCFHLVSKLIKFGFGIYQKINDFCIHINYLQLILFHILFAALIFTLGITIQAMFNFCYIPLVICFYCSAATTGLFQCLVIIFSAL